MGLFKNLLGVAAAGAALDVAAAKILFDYTLAREHLGTDNSRYFTGLVKRPLPPVAHEARDWLMEQPSTDVFIPGRDGKMLHGVWLPAENPGRVVLCFHGYASSSRRDFADLARFYAGLGFGVLLVDMRAHGQSEGKYTSLGVLERLDVLEWVSYVQRKSIDGLQLVLHGVSIGATAALMAAGSELPGSVRGIVADSAFTNGWDLFEGQLRSRSGLPAFPLLHTVDQMAKRVAGFDLAGCSAAEEVAKASVPILLIRGEQDTVVPRSMCDRIYESCASPTHLLTVPGAGHGEAYYTDVDQCRHTLETFLQKVSL